MLVVTWNVNAKSGATAERLERITSSVASKTASVILLQEVGEKVAHKLLQKLEGVGLSAFFGGVPGGEGKRCGNVIAAQGKLMPAKPNWSKAPWPQLLTRATAVVNDMAVDVVSAHMPNGSGNGWKKIDTFTALSEALASAPRMPRILGGDFNEPWKFLPDGDLVSFGADRDREPKFWFQGDRTGPKLDGKPRESRPRTEWDAAVRNILAWGASHGLRHTHQVVHGFEPVPETHVVRGESRFFDHLLVSEDFVVKDAGIFHDWRMAGLSDHSGAWAEITLAREG